MRIVGSRNESEDHSGLSGAGYREYRHEVKYQKLATLKTPELLV